MSAQHNLTALCKRLAAALSLVVAATLATSAPELAQRTGVGNAAAIDALVADLGGLAEDEQGKYPDRATAGDGRAKVRAPVAYLEIQNPPSKGARPVHAGSGVRRTHAARSGLTRAPPPA